MKVFSSLQIQYSISPPLHTPSFESQSLIPGMEDDIKEAVISY
jgi:hypothetical protein